MESWLVFDYTMETNMFQKFDSTFERLIMFLDDYPSLNLESGSFYSLYPNNARYFFETNKIDHVSPSFISRTNFIYIEHEIVTPSLLFNKFVEVGLINIFAEYKDKLKSLFETIYLEFLKSIKTELKNETIIELNDIIQTLNLIKYLDMLFYEYIKQLLVNEKINVRELDFDVLKNVSF